MRPPASGKSLVTLENWQGPPFNRWSYQHMSEIVPSACVRRGTMPSTPLARCPRDLDEVAITRVCDETETVAAWLERTYTDGFIVLHGGRVVAERYFNGMTAQTRHLLQSVSKSITGILAGSLWGQGLLDEGTPLTAYMPELAGTSFAGATVRHVLDMSCGTRFSEDYDDPDADIRRYESAAGWQPAQAGASTDLLSYMLELPNARPHGGLFEYRSILTDLLGILLERAAGMRFADALSHFVWSNIGAEHDAEITVDRHGNPMTDGGISTTVRDLARFGQMVLQYGCAEGRQIVPAAWLQDTLVADEECREAFARSESAARYPRGHYRNQWWVPDGSRRVLLGAGIYGQTLYVDFEAGVVVVKLSSLPVPLDLSISADTLSACRAIARALSAKDG
jgi:CubicO group peptidase (beta-lactamase class C family)